MYWLCLYGCCIFFSIIINTTLVFKYSAIINRFNTFISFFFWLFRFLFLCTLVLYSKLSLCTVEQDVPAPQISMPNQSTNRYGEDGAESKKDSPVKAKKSPVKQEKPATAGWFGGIWNRLALRPKNQMKLPDDKNPSVCINMLVYLSCDFPGFISVIVFASSQILFAYQFLFVL